MCFMNKGYIIISFVNCLIMQTIVVLLVFYMIFDMSEMAIGPAGAGILLSGVFVAFIVVMLPTIALHIYVYHGFSLKTDPANPLRNINPRIFPYLHFASVEDASYGGFMFGGALGVVVKILITTILWIVKIVKNYMRFRRVRNYTKILLSK